MENSFAAKSTPDSEEETTEQFLDFDHTYAQFRADHPVRQIHLKGHKWEYIDTGTGDVLILLPGFFGVAGTDFMYILGLKNFFHIISITYPETIYSIDMLATGLFDLMNELDLHPANILGGSFSGYVAQVFLWRYPKFVNKIILAQTSLPQRIRIPLAVFLGCFLRILPLRVLHRLLQMINALYYPTQNPQNTFWRHYFSDLIKTFSQQALINRFQLVADFHSKHRSTQHDLASWRGSMLILDSTDDGMLSPQDSIELHQKYPTAQIARIPGSHTRSVYDPGEQILAVREFIQNASFPYNQILTEQADPGV